MARIRVKSAGKIISWLIRGIVVTMKLRIKTVPLKQWDVGRELRKRIKRAFDRHGIEIPFPQREVRVRDGATPAERADTASGA